MNVIMQDQLPVGLRAVIVDISERKTYENHLEKLASIVENSPFAMVEADKEGNLELVNEKAIQLKTLIVNNQESIISQVKGVYETKHKVENRLIFDNIEYNFLYVFNEKLNRVNIFISS
jgi:hypothetical protein